MSVDKNDMKRTQPLSSGLVMFVDLGSKIRAQPFRCIALYCTAGLARLLNPHW